MNQPTPDFDDHWRRLTAANPRLADPAQRLTLTALELRRLLARAHAAGRNGAERQAFASLGWLNLAWLRAVLRAAFLEGYNDPQNKPRGKSDKSES